MQKNYRPKILTLDYVNRVRIEKSAQFQDSLFEEVYYSACRLTKKIIKDNEQLEENVSNTEQSTDELYSNMIAFLGGRGMGKSSAMRSFALYLENYVPKTTENFCVDTQMISPYFSVLPRIDASMMIKGEDIMDILLAKMWDVFEKRTESTHKHEIYLKELKADFNKIKKSYEIYKMTQDGREIMQNMTSVRQMHELAVCLNLRQDFIELVENYLGFVLCDKPCQKKDRFLVITIDDLDMVMRDTYSIMEQIRLFLLIPKVIVLVTADMDRLTMVCNKQFTENLICRDNCADYEKQQVREYAVNYLAKLFPGNMRIYMPKIGTFAGVECEIIEGGEHFDEKRLMLIFMAKYSNIFYMPYNWRGHFLQKGSLREIVNSLHLLLDISKQDQEVWFDLMCSWYTTELSEYCKGIENPSLRQELLGIYNGNYNKRYLNTIIQRALILAINDFEMTDGIGYDYGDILLLLDMVSNQEKIYNFTVLAFSVQLANVKRRPNDSIYCGSRIFHSILAHQNGRQNLMADNRCGMEKVHSLGDLLNINLVYSESMAGENEVLEILCSNKYRVLEIVRIGMLSDINIWDAQQTNYLKWKYSQTGKGELTREINNVKADLEDTAPDIIGIQCVIPYNVQVWISIDNLFFRALEYRKYLWGIMRNIYIGLSDYLGRQETEEQINNHIEQILSDPIWHLNEYKEWEKKYGVRSIMDILPLESVELMHCLVRDMRDSLPIERWQMQDKGYTLGYLKAQLENIISTLKHVEKYYESDLLDGFKYSEKISEYLDIVDITNLSGESGKKLDMHIYNMPSALNF